MVCIRGPTAWAVPASHALAALMPTWAKPRKWGGHFSRKLFSFAGGELDFVGNHDIHPLFPVVEAGKDGGGCRETCESFLRVADISLARVPRPFWKPSRTISTIDH